MRYPTNSWLIIVCFNQMAILNVCHSIPPFLYKEICFSHAHFPAENLRGGFSVHFSDRWMKNGLS